MSMYKELEYDNDINLITGIQFCLLSPENIRKQSVVEVVSHEIYNGTEPVKGGVLDMRMGTIDNSRRCPTCGQRNVMCPGHFGHVELARPMFYMQFINTIKQLLKSVCFKCGSIAVGDLDRKQIMRYKRKKRFEVVYEKASKATVRKECHFCKCRLPSTITRENLNKFILEWKKDPKDADGSTPLQVTLYPEDIIKIFKRISDEDAELMGFSATLNRPEWLICSVFPVPPPCMRPTVHNDIGQRREDDLTHKICEIVKHNNHLKADIASNASRKEIEAISMLLQYHLATYADNTAIGGQSLHRNGRPIKSIVERLERKEGRIRGNLMGKRVDFSARSVITPDPNISIDEVGVPLKIAMNLTFPEIVSRFNIDRLQEMVNNGPGVYPGAKFVKKMNEKKRTVRINNQVVVTIDIGDIVHRHLLDGDPVLFNRQPSLHKASMMCHRVHVMEGDTFRLNVCVCPPYNADMDGDEMNMHVPQSIQTATELRHLAAVPLQIVSPRTSTPIIGIIQDMTVGVYRLTQPTTSVKRRDAFNILSSVGNFDGVVDQSTQKTMTGVQLLSSVIPIGTYFSTKGVDVIDGIITRGTIVNNKDTKTYTKLMHDVYAEHGSDATRRMLDDTQRLVCEWLCISGFSMGVKDLMMTQDVLKSIDSIVQTGGMEVDDILTKVRDGLFVNDQICTVKERVERVIMGVLGGMRAKVDGLMHLDVHSNRMMNMIESGAKGSIVNVVQIAGILGQQEVEDAKMRVPYGFEDRTLPHFHRFDDSMDARGFVDASFVKGLQPTQYFFHAIAAREGLIDTSCKSVTGDTPIVIIQGGKCLYTQIGQWIDDVMSLRPNDIETFPEDMNMEMLSVVDVFIPTADSMGRMMWGEVTNVSRHDPGEVLYKICTQSGKSVTVTSAKSLLIYDTSTGLFTEKATPDVVIGDHVPVTSRLPSPPFLALRTPCGLDLDADTGTLLACCFISGGDDDGEVPCVQDKDCIPGCVLMARHENVAAFVNEVGTNDVSSPDFMDMLRARLHYYDDNDVNDSNEVNDVYLDPIVSIELVAPSQGQKVYDVTCPITQNFTLANGVCVKNTSDVGYLQRKLVKAMEDYKIAFDMTVRNVANMIVQFSYGGDGFDATRLYKQVLPTITMDVEQVKVQYGCEKDDMFKDAMTHEAFAMKDAWIDTNGFVHQVLDDRLWFAHNVSQGKMNDNCVMFPVNMPRVLKYAHNLCNQGRRLLSDLTPHMIFECISRIEKDLRISPMTEPTKMLGVLLRAYLNPRTLIVDYGFTKNGLACIEERIRTQFLVGIAHPSELVGILAAQSIGEPATQMTLNTFHFSGQGAITKVVSQGVPRLKELLSASSNIKTPVMAIRVVKSVCKDSEQVRRLMNELELTRLRDIVTESALYYDPTDSIEGLNEDDKKFVSAWHQFEVDVGCIDTTVYTPWVIRFEFDKLLMLDKGLVMYDVYHAITSSFTENAKCVYSDDNYSKLIMRIRVADNKAKDFMHDLKVMEQSLLDDIILKGAMHGKREIRRAIKYEEDFKDIMDEASGAFVTSKEFCLSTDGSNMLDVLGHPLVCDVMTTTNDVDEMKGVLGIEATRTTLLKELKTTLAGLYVQDRHLELLADVITCKGATMSIDRFGINRGDIGGPLAKCSFEESVEMLIQAGIFAEVDKMNGVSANVMVGQIPACGTGDSKILIDFDKLTSVYTSTSAAKTDGAGGDVEDSTMCDNGLEMLKYDFDTSGSGTFL